MKYELPMSADKFEKTNPKIGTKFLLVCGLDTYRCEILDTPYGLRWAWSTWWKTEKGEAYACEKPSDWQLYTHNFLFMYTIIEVTENTRKIGKFVP